MKQPAPPKNVRILRDGREIPLELLYRGKDDEGQHVWVAVSMKAQEGDQLKVEELPAHTSIIVEG